MYRGGGDSWSGDQTYEDACKNIYKGNQKATDESIKILDRLEADSIEIETSYWDNDRTGFIPCVPSYIAGSPDSMRRLVEMQSDQAPVKVFAGVCLSAGFSASALLNRGTAILALVRKLGMLRPVELWVYADMQGKSTDEYGACAIPIIKLETSPLDLATVSYILADPGFLRRVCFGWADVRGFTGSWAWSEYNDTVRAKKIRQFCKLSDTDIIVDSSCLGFSDLKDPVKWVNDQIKKYLKTAQESEN
jgi:hypothetical protein